MIFPFCIGFRHWLPKNGSSYWSVRALREQSFQFFCLHSGKHQDDASTLDRISDLDRIAQLVSISVSVNIAEMYGNVIYVARQSLAGLFEGQMPQSYLA